ncbi:MAG: RNA polymerase sporulation sigma factor SigK [Candidatus Coprovivens sp.]
MFFNLFNLIKSLLFMSGSYSNTVFPPTLSIEEENECVLKMKDDNKYRNKLIEHNLRLVAHIVKKFEGIYKDTDDLISIGTIGLIKGIDSYDSSKNIRITTYAARCIENEILMYFRSNKKYCNDVSLNDYIGVDKDGNSISLIDVIEDEGVDLSVKVSNSIDIEALIKYLDVLKKQEREIIIKRYGLFNSKEYTQKEIAHEMGISRSYVSRIEKKALYKLLREFNKTK